MTLCVTKRSLWLWPVLLLATHVWSQTTSVTLQITDTDVQTWNNGTWIASLYSPPGVPSNNYVIAGTSTSVPNQQQNGTLNGTGAGSLTVTPNTNISPSGTQWQFTFCPQATPTQCPQYAYSITGASFNIAPTPPGVRVSVQNPQVHALAYLDLEITGAVIGSQYYNIGVLTGTRVCTIVVSGVCTTWAPISVGGTATGLSNLGNTVTLTSNGIFINSNGGQSSLFLSTLGFAELFDLAGDNFILGVAGGEGAFFLENAAGSAFIKNPSAGEILLHDDEIVSNGPFTGPMALTFLWESLTTPVILSGFCGDAAILASNGTAAFTMNVGSCGTAFTGTLTMPAATHGWACNITNNSNPGGSNTRAILGSAISVVFNNYNAAGSATAWGVNDLLRAQCSGY